jgi:hypothetical protein
MAASTEHLPPRQLPLRDLFGLRPKKNSRGSPTQFSLGELTNTLHTALVASSNPTETANKSELIGEQVLTSEFELLRRAFSTDQSDLCSSLLGGLLVDAIDSRVPGFGGGLSGCQFYCTADHRYVFKSLKRGPKEFFQLQTLLPNLATHVTAYSVANSLCVDSCSATRFS